MLPFCNPTICIIEHSLFDNYTFLTYIKSTIKVQHFLLNFLQVDTIFDILYLASGTEYFNIIKNKIQKFRNSEIQKFRNSEIQKFRNSEIQKFREIQKPRKQKNVSPFCNIMIIENAKNGWQNCNTVCMIARIFTYYKNNSIFYESWITDDGFMGAFISTRAE